MVFENFRDTTIYFSKIDNAPIVNEDGQRLGSFCDFFVDYEEIYPVVLAVQYRQSNQLFYLNWDDIKSFSYKEIVVKNSAEVYRSRNYPKIAKEKVVTSLLASQFSGGGTTVEYPPIGKVILDRQIVDTSGKKVVRVNDIHFIKVNRFIRVTHASVGFRSMVRRLGFEIPVDAVVKVFNSKARYLTSESVINWKYVHAIPDRTVQRNVKLSLSNEDLQNIHPADLADILEELDGHGREQIFKNLDPELAAKTLSEIESEEIQTSLINTEHPEKAAEIIENMGTDEAADILSELDDTKADQIIAHLDNAETKEEISELLEYDEESAGGLMSTGVFSVSPKMTRGEVLKKIQKDHEEIESIYDLYVVDTSNHLLGVCSLKELLIRDDSIEIASIMNDNDIKFLPPTTMWKEVATFMSKYNLITVPIVDSTNELLGIVSVDDILPWLLDES